jgi:hypothetical protein
MLNDNNGGQYAGGTNLCEGQWVPVVRKWHSFCNVYDYYYYYHKSVWVSKCLIGLLIQQFCLICLFIIFGFVSNENKRLENEW